MRLWRWPCTRRRQWEWGFGGLVAIVAGRRGCGDCGGVGPRSRRYCQAIQRLPPQKRLPTWVPRVGRATGEVGPRRDCLGATLAALQTKVGPKKIALPLAPSPSSRSAKVGPLDAIIAYTSKERYRNFRLPLTPYPRRGSSSEPSMDVGALGRPPGAPRGPMAPRDRLSVKFNSY